jgi:hypothetical protein
VLLTAMKDILAEMNRRQVAAGRFLYSYRSVSLLSTSIDISSQPIPQLDAEAPLAWNALYKSMNEHMEPEIDRWKNGLDAMLVFVRSFPFRLAGSLQEFTPSL